MSAPHKTIDKTRFTDSFNLGFRRGANDRAELGLGYAFTACQSLRQPPVPPPPPAEWPRDEWKVWEMGYGMGFQIGSSDAELASVEIPGASGMVSGLGEEMLEMMGLFKVDDGEGSDQPKP